MINIQRYKLWEELRYKYTYSMITTQFEVFRLNVLCSSELLSTQPMQNKTHYSVHAKLRRLL
jgi:hypothetical protein